MYVILYILWVGWAVQAILSVLQVRKYARRFEHGRRPGFDRYRPKAVVIVPFKGLEPGLEGNLAGLFTQNYPDYRLLLVVDSTDDDAYPVIQRFIETHPHRQAELLVSGKASNNEGQKVHNHLASIAHLEQQAGGEEVWVFADSDAVPGPDWLGEIVGPLGQTERTAVTTGYRWLIPEPGETGRVTVWSHLASVMNSSVACFMGKDRLNQAWGGSMALRVETAHEGDLKAAWQGAITDDYPVTHLAKRLGKRVYFVPGCLIASPVHFTLPTLVNFGHRQYLITRTYAPGLWAAGLAILSLYVVGFFSAWAALGHELYHRPEQGGWLWPLIAMVVVGVANQLRAGYRKRAIRNAFSSDMLTQLRTTLRWDRFGTPIWMTLHWLLLIRAGLGRTMRWRGILYHVRGPHDVQRLQGS